MAQFDVYRNHTKASREAIPYYVDIQSDLLSDLSTRLIIPLGNPQVIPIAGPKALSPAFQIQGESLTLLPHLATPARLKDLGKPVVSLASHSSELISAFDAVISGV